MDQFIQTTFEKFCNFRRYSFLNVNWKISLDVPSGVPSQWHNDFFSQEGSKEAVAAALKKHYSTTFFDRGILYYSSLT